MTDKHHEFTRPAGFARGGCVVRFAESDRDLRRAQALRHLCFIEQAGLAPREEGLERDRFDPRCEHVIVEGGTGQVLCTFRLVTHASGAQVRQGYAAQFYDLTRIALHPAPMVELGRVCVHPDAEAAEILRLAWGMVAAYVDAATAQLLFGCSSFTGTQAARYRAAFDLLAARHLVPVPWQIGEGSNNIQRFAANAAAVSDHRAALAQLPPLLRSYLAMGGWVSDHAVIDREMNTLHVFTGLEIAKIPAARARALRAVARGATPA